MHHIYHLRKYAQRKLSERSIGPMWTVSSQIVRLSWKVPSHPEVS